MKSESAEFDLEIEDANKLKRYLLDSDSVPQAEKEKIEERLLLDQEYFEELLRQEEELTQEFADDELSERERRDFVSNFLISDERRGKLQFARTFKDYVTAGQELNAEKEDYLKPGKKGGRNSHLPALNFLHLTAILIALTAVGLAAFWGFSYYFRRSPALIALNSAYGAARPLESRISNFEYSPYPESRGEAADQVNLTELRRAQLLSLDFDSEHPTAEKLHDLGRMYLAGKDFDAAVTALEEAGSLNSPTAEIFSDLGIAYLEKGKLAEKDSPAKLEFAGKALENFDQALKIKPSSPLVYFNKALCLQFLNLHNQAHEAWTRYLQLDDSSPWAEETRRNLQDLNSKQVASNSAEEAQSKFIAAYQAKDDEQAWRIASDSREVILEKYLPQKLVMSYVNADEASRDQFLRALDYLGKLESERMGETYTRELAEFYRSASPEQIAVLKTAQDSVKKGYKLCLDNNFSAAKDEFTQAQNIFQQAGDTPEATLSLIFIAYSLYNHNQKPEALEIYQKVDTLASRHGYKWLYLTNRSWLIGAEERLGYKDSTEIKNDYENTLSQTDLIGDSYLIQKLLMVLAVRSQAVNQEAQTLKYLQKMVEVADASGTGVRQKARNFGQGAEALGKTSFPSLAKAYILEGLSYSRETNNDLFIIEYEIDCGNVFTKAKDFDAARGWFLNAQKDIKIISEKADRDALQAKVLLKLGNLERESNNFQAAIADYDQALQLNVGIVNPAFPYEARKARLFSLQALGDEERVGQAIPEVINTAEDYRSQITDEQERESFFDNEQAVYDTAVEHSIRRQDYEQAFNYAETSNSRSLLDWLHQKASVVNNGETSSVVFNASVKPLELAAIREKMPAGVQLVQYYELDNKLIIWLVSREKFATVTVDVNSSELETLINSYSNLLQINKPKEQAAARELGQKLYQLLIGPVSADLDPNKEICFVPNKSLYVLPFASLIDEQGQYLISKFVPFYAPSANVFIFCTETAARKNSRNDETFLGIGNPKFSPEKFPGLPNLPDAVSEVEVSSRDYASPALLLNETATKDSFKQKAFQHDVVHFAGHYLVQNGSFLNSGLLFSNSNEQAKSGELLTNRELLQSKPSQSRLVILSACQTGIEQHYKGEGLIGLARTFLANGTPLVLGTGWKVESRAAARLMIDFHHYRRQQKMSTVAALRQAQLKMLEDSAGGYQSPYFWAPFTVFGGYAEF